MNTSLRKNQSRKPDAAESNAGDDFHVLWGVRKSLALLNFDREGIKAVAIEGLTPEDEDPLSDDTLLAVDLTEYYGGENFETAKKVVVSQLKYSTRHPDKTWTVATICTGKKHAWKGSILHRLATFYKGFCKDQVQDAISKKLVIKLVSNRPAAEDLQKALIAIQQYIISNPATAVLKTILNEIDEQFTVSIQRMADSSGLSDKEFLGFVRVLDVSDCKVGSRLFQEQQLLQAISELGSYKTEDEFNRLYELIRRKMMPESRGHNTIKQVDILYQFKLSDIRDLFPVEARFQNGDRLIEREQIPAIISSIQSANDGKMLLHGGAGMGKSSIVQMISGQLPTGSISLLFDCYGAGTYLDSDDKRHKPENAFLQLSNQLALLAGTPLLIARDLRSDIYLRELKRRLELAAQIVQQINTEAIILLIVDAADNSIHAAEQSGDVSFINDLIGMSVPKGCRLLFTSRTGRVDNIPLSDEIDKEEINSFSLPETEEFLQLNFNTVSSKEAEDFRQLTKATPRVMSYALSIPGDSLSEKLKPLKPGGKELNDIFKLRIKEAQRRSGNNKAINDFLHYLISLPRPVPLAYLRALSGLSDALLQDIQTDLWQGIIFQNNQFSFRDEDFENFLRSAYPFNTDKLNAISKVFLAAAESDEYASLHLGNALRLADKGQHLIDIVLGGKFQQYPKDPIRLKEMVVKRTRMAMEFSMSIQSSVDLIKLQMVAAEAAKTNTVLERILLDNAELASAFGNAAMAQKLYFQSGNPGWFGSVHFRSAAVHSRNINTHLLAKEHLKKAKDWLHYRDTVSKEERDNYEIKEIDLAYSAEAILRISGPKACADWLSSWTPVTFILKVIKLLLRNLMELGEQKQLIKWLKPLKLSIDIKLLVTQTFFLQGLQPPFSLKEMASQLTKMRRLSKGANFSMADELISFCEYANIHGVSHEQVKLWLDLIHYKKPQYTPSFYDTQYYALDREKDDLDIMFRKECLLAYLNGNQLEVNQFYPDYLLAEINSTSSQSKRSHDEEKVKFDRLYKHILSVFQTRAAFLFKIANPSILKEQLKQVQNAIERDYELTYRFERQLPYFFKFLCVRLLDIVFYNKDTSLISVIEKGFTVARQSNTSFYLAMSDRLSSAKIFHQKVLHLLQKVEQSIEKDTLSGSEQLDHYTKATIIGSRVSLATGQLYFDKMVQTADEIDEEGIKQIKALSSFILSEKSWQQPKLAFAFSRFTEYCHLHLQREHFPWTEAINGITRLCPPTSMAVLCRWDHRDVLDYYKILNEVLEEVIRQEYIDHGTAAALLTLNHYYWPGLMRLIESILQGFDKEQDYIGKELFVHDFIRDLQLHCNRYDQLETLENFGNLIKNGKFLSTGIVTNYESYCKRVAELKQATEEETSRQDARYKKHPNRKKQKNIFKKIDFTSTVEISYVLGQAKNNEDYGYFNVETIFEEMRQLVNVNDYTKHLSALLFLDAELIDFWSYKKGFLLTLNAWSLYPEVKAWKQESFYNFLKQHFTHFISFDQFNANDLNEFASVFEINSGQLGNYIFQILPQYLDELSASVLYELLPFTAAGISKNEKEKLLEWILPKWSQKIKPDLGDGIWDEKYIPPKTSGETTGYFLRYFLGHPNKYHRWRAAHSLRRFAKFGNASIVDNLFPLLNQTHNGQFQDNTFLFYWLSAKLYFWIAMERISKESINFILPYSDTLISELKNNETPHILVWKFVKSICNQVIDHPPAIYNNAERLFIQNVNFIGRNKEREQKNKTRAKEHKTRFHFDTLDTVPYWYSSIVHSLGCSMNTFLQTADEFITQRWGYTGNPHENDPAQTEEWTLTSNRHGSEPIVERLRIYFEYHAMFCAAGHLLENAKVQLDTDEEEEDGWLYKWGLRWDNFWLADLRDPIPLLPEFWRKKRTEGDWEFEIQLADFDRVIGLSTGHQTGYLVIDANSKIYYGKDYESASVSSVLVAPKYAPSLLRSLQTSDDLLNSRLYENEQRDDYEDEDDEPFVKKGWIINYGRDRESVDDNDEFYNRIDKCRKIPGKLFQDWANIQFSPDYRYSYKDDPEDHVTRLQVWNNHDSELYYDSFSTDGSRLEMKTSSLLTFLKETNNCLLIGCDIRRHPDRSYTRHEYYPEYTRFYLIYSNGRIETISGDYQLR